MSVDKFANINQIQYNYITLYLTTLNEDYKNGVTKRNGILMRKEIVPLIKKILEN
jgi:hypothetical protein